MARTRAPRVLAALLRIGWHVKHESGGTLRVLAPEGWPDLTWAFHDREEIGPRMLARIAKLTGRRITGSLNVGARA